jgi:hypothetical protein
MRKVFPINKSSILHGVLVGSVFFCNFCDVAKMAIDPQERFNQIWLQAIIESNFFWGEKNLHT